MRPESGSGTLGAGPALTALGRSLACGSECGTPEPLALQPLAGLTIATSWSACRPGDVRRGHARSNAPGGSSAPPLRDRDAPDSREALRSHLMLPEDRVGSTRSGWSRACDQPGILTRPEQHGLRSARAPGPPSV